MQRTQTAHFWLGHFPDGSRVGDYFTEVWNENDGDREHTPLSEFARDQQKKWYDHDYLEYGFNPDASSIQELVTGYSYHDQYKDELAARAAKLGLAGINMFVFIEESQIAHPRSIAGEGYTLHYVGTITYRI
jgi:hypothetical protein